MKKANIDKLKKYGFKKKNNSYVLYKNLHNDEFRLTVSVFKDSIKTELKEIETDEIYTLHLVEGVEGDFVGKIKEEYNKILDDIKEKCFDNEVFEWDYTKKIIEHVKEKYGDDAEYLWKKFPRNAVCRRKDNKKWYLALLSLKGCKFGFDTDEIIEVIDLRSDDVQNLIKHPNIYEGYHMNKKHWITIVLDGSVNLDEIYKFIDISYNLAKK